MGLTVVQLVVILSILVNQVEHLRLDEHRHHRLESSVSHARRGLKLLVGERVGGVELNEDGHLVHGRHEDVRRSEVSCSDLGFGDVPEPSELSTAVGERRRRRERG